MLRCAPGTRSLCCPCGGDGIKRHNCLRWVVTSRSQAAGLGVARTTTGPMEVVAPVSADLQSSGWRSEDCRAGLLHLISPLRRASGPPPLPNLPGPAKQPWRPIQFLPVVAEACSGGWGTHCHLLVAHARWPHRSSLWGHSCCKDRWPPAEQPHHHFAKRKCTCGPPPFARGRGGDRHIC